MRHQLSYPHSVCMSEVIFSLRDVRVTLTRGTWSREKRSHNWMKWINRRQGWILEMPSLITVLGAVCGYKIERYEWQCAVRVLYYVQYLTKKWLQMALVAGGDGVAGQAGEVQTKYKSTLAYPRESFVIVSWLILRLHWECHAWQHSALELRETSCPPSPSRLFWS